MEESVSLLLPCNVVLAETPAGTRISIADPRALMSSDEFAPLAAEAAERLTAALAAVTPTPVA